MAQTRLFEKYKSEVIKGLMDKFGYKNIMEVPKLEKVVINMGVGEAKDNSKLLDSAVSELEAIIHIFEELSGNEGVLVASKIADRVGITRSVIVNALRKFESAGVIEGQLFL